MDRSPATAERVRRLAVLAAAVLMPACVATGGARGGPAEEGAVVFPDGSFISVRGSASPRIVRELPGDPGTLWAELIDVYTDLGMEVGGADPGSHTVSGATMVHTRTFQGERLSTFMECGQEPGVVSVADAFRVTWSLVSGLAAAGEGRSALEMRLVGVARPPGGGALPYACRSTGELEGRMARALGERYALARAGRSPRALTPSAPDARLPPETAGGTPGAVEAVPAELQPAVVLRPRSTALLIAGAAGGASAGYLLGTRVGSGCETRCLNAKGTLGPLVGGTVFIPLGVHAANSGRGMYTRTFLASAGWAMLGVVVAGYTDETWPIWAMMPGQVITSVYLERTSTRTERRR